MRPTSRDGRPAARLLLAALALCAALGVPASLTLAAPRAAEPAGPSEAALVLRARAELHRAVGLLRERQAVLDPKRPLLPVDERRFLRSTFGTVLDQVRALEAVRQAHPQLLRAVSGSPRLDGFQAGRAAFLAAYRGALDWLALAEQSPVAAKVLDEEAPDQGLPPGAYAGFKLHYLNAARATELAALEAVARTVPADAVLGPAAAEDADALWRQGRGAGTALTARNALVVVGRAGFGAWFPVQKGFSTWAGDTRVRRGESALIGPAQIAALPGRLQPGDVLLERREWYLSNLGLPGFWTHAALYVGTPEERKALLAEPGVVALARELGRGDGDLEALLAERAPAAARASRTADAAGHAPRVLEAISEGVSFTTLEHSAAADALAVLRPRLPARERAQALLRAFRYAGRPYDFDFDFRTDAALVCSELVYKAYEPGEGMVGLTLPLEEVAGRTVSTPNGLARQLDEELAAGAPQLELVVFLDGSEKQGGAAEAGLDEFRRSWRRPKWHILTK